MSNKLYFKLKLVFLIAFVGCILGTLSLALRSNLAVAQVFESSSVLQEEYMIGQTVEIPSGHFGDYVADIVITTPDGNAYLTQEITLSQPGVYKVEYRKEIGGKLYKEVKTFKAVQKAYGFSKFDSKSTVSYGKDENGQWSQWDSGKEGLLISLAKGESFIYNKVFDIKKTSESNPAIKFSLTPSTKGSSDAEYMYVTFTDVYNKENKIEYKISLSNGQQEYTYVCARATNQYWVGNEGNKWHVNNIYGTPIYFTPGGYLLSTANYVERTNTVKEQSVGLYYDYESNSAQLSYTYFHRDWGASHTISNVVVSDFDNLAVQDNPWTGLTTGEVYCTVSFDGYKGAFANVIIESLAGFNLSDDKYNFVEGADISVDMLGYEVENLPKAKVGYKYPVFEGVALDKNVGRQIQLETRVFYNYSRSTGVYYGLTDVNYNYEVGIINGKFTTDKEGKYAICYRAKDSLGIVKEYVIEVESVDNVSLPEMKPISIENDKKVFNQLVGNIVDVPNIIDFGGGFGDLSIGAEVKFANNLYSVNIKDRNEGYYFIPENPGIYTVCLYAEDFYGQRAEIEYEVNIAINNYSAVNEFVDIPKYLIEQEIYYLPNINDFGNQYCNIKIIDGLGERNYEGHGAYFVGDQNGQAIIRYYIGESSYDYIRPVIKVKQGSSLNVDKFFVSNDLEVRNTASGVGLLTYQKDGSAEFIRDLSDKKLSITSYVNIKRNEFNRVSYYLTDSRDYSIALKLTFENNGSFVKLYINDKDIKLDITTANFSNSALLMAEYKADSKRVSFAGAREMPINETLFGADFNGFPSGKVNIRIGVENVIGKAEVFVVKINNQDFNKWVLEDSVKPQINFNGNFSKLYYYVGEVFTVLSTVQDDVLSTYVYTVVTVNFDGKPVVDIEGEVLLNALSSKEYFVRFTQIGTYSISYITIDSAGNSSVYSFNIKVKDSEQPIITINGTVPQKAKLGLVNLPSFKAEDNCTKTCITYITLTAPNNYTIILSNNSFTATMVGDYVVSYYAMDEEGNVAVKTYTIIVL